jgi:hypothetical protein
MKLFKHRPSPALVVALLALFVALAGTGVAATGGNFILGQSNSAGQTTALSSGVTTGPTLNLTNTGSRPAVRFTANSGVQPFSVSNSTKVGNLNADKLDGVDASGLIQGRGTAYQRRIVLVVSGANTVTADVIKIPGLGEIVGSCAPTPYGPHALLSFHNGSGETLRATWWILSSVTNTSIAPDDSAQLGTDTPVLLQLGADAKAATVVASGVSATVTTCEFQAQALAIG